ncbi:MAG: hypothetical protein QOI45_1699 [Thermoleophilaceae bacterium]|jgi:hypothetical protein|nr:hypothetical protein [Thermoleophilaceae bacterium]MEA2455437.1 hypothetical protein [Thermoleophilaceae bacterium]
MRLLLALAGCLVLSAALAVPAGADTTVRGTLEGARGYTLNGTTANGQVVFQRLPASGKFKLRFKGRTGRGATLHLIRRGGGYLGPVVLSRKGRQAFLKLSGKSVDLGRIKLRRGYAAPLVAVKKQAFAGSAARADARGRPLGAGRVGLVAAKASARSSQNGGGSDAAGADTDRDGVANAYDVDDDGDLTLDSVDSDASPSGAGLFSTLFLGFTEAVNANAGATRAQIDSIFSGENRFALVFYFDAGQFGSRRVTGAHVDCFALAYCRRGGGTAVLTGVSESSSSLPRGSLWTDYDPDGSGYPNLERLDQRSAFVAGIQPRVTTSQITPGDTYNVIFRTSGGTITVPTTLSSYFVTTPMLTNVSGAEPIALGSEQFSATFWRPQRAAVPGAEAGSFADMGHLHYGVTIGGEGISREFSCAGHYSALSSTLTAEASSGVLPEEGASLFPLVDSADDAAPNPARTLSFTVDVGACLRGAGFSSAGRTVFLTLTAASEPRPGGQDRAAQTVRVQLP